MGWEEPIHIWRNLAPFEREVPLLALIAIIDAFTGLSQSVATRLGFAKRRDLVLLAVLLACEIRLVWWGDFQRWETVFGTQPGDPALLDTWRHRNHVEYMISKAYEVLIFGCAIICAVWAKLQKRSFFVWFPIGFIGTVGAIVWLHVNRPRAQHQDLQEARL